MSLPCCEFRGGLLSEIKKCILVVEDDSDLRSTIQEVLEMEGFRVLTAKNGQDALDLLESQAESPALVLLDMMMPVMNGAECLNALRARPRFSKLPVFVISAGGQKAAHPMANGFIKKPVDIDKLIEVARLNS
jgi:CheY-like chemotaxis protein